MRLQRRLVPLGLLAMMNWSCADGVQRANPLKAKEDKKKSEGAAEGLNFTDDLAGSGRQVQFANYASTWNINFNQLHPKTAAFYGVSPNAIQHLNDPADRDILFKFTNVQEAIPVSVAYEGFRRLCTEEGYPNLKACLDDAIERSGAVVFQPVSKLTTSADPNDPNLFRDVVFNMMGVTTLQLEPNGEAALTLSCVSCHSSFNVRPDRVTGALAMQADWRGDNTGPDGKRTMNGLDVITRAKNIVANPSDPIWNISNRTKAAGLLAAQMERVRGTHGNAHYLSDSHVIKYLNDATVSRSVNIGWLFAMASASSYARTVCDEDWSSSDQDQNCLRPLDDQTVAQRTDRTVLENFLPNGSRYNITQAFFSKGSLDNIPDRPQRSLHKFVNHDLQFDGKFNPTFTLQYYMLTPYMPDWQMPQVNQRYLLGATAASAVVPANYDLQLSRNWLGSAATSASARAYVNQNAPRVVVRGYQYDSMMYHTARGRQPKAPAAAYAPLMSSSELLAASNYVKQNCVTCHNTGAVFLDQAKIDACPVGSDCSIKTVAWRLDETAKSKAGELAFQSPTSMFGRDVMGAIHKAPEPFSGTGYAWAFQVNSQMMSQPRRITFLNRHAVLDWGYRSFVDALSSSPPQAQYAVMSPVTSANGVAQVRSMVLNMGLSGAPGTMQELRCNASASFVINGVTMACREAIKTLSGYTPRLINGSDLIATHATVVRPHTLGVSAASVNLFMHALDLGRVAIQTPAGMKHMVFTYDDKELFMESDSGNSGGGDDGSSGGGGGYGGGDGGYGGGDGGYGGGDGGYGY
jgi:hypothetical protein